MLPSRYRLDNLELFFRCNAVSQRSAQPERWVRVDRRIQLGAVLSNAQYEVPGFPVLWVLAKGTAHHTQFVRKHMAYLGELQLAPG